MKTLQPLASSGLNLPENSYIYSIVPTSHQVDAYTIKKTSQLAAICSDDSLRFFDAATLALSPDGVLTGVNNSVTCLKRFDAEGNVFATSGRDGLVRCWDKRSKKNVLEVRTPKGLPLSALECSLSTNALAAGTELEGNGPGEAPVYVWDSRNPATPLLELLESHTDTITELQFHPDQPSLLLSGSTDGLINIFSVDQPTEEDALHQIINHRSAIHRAGFLDPSTCIYGLGTDETLSVFALQNPDQAVEEPAPRPFGDLRDPVKCEYVVGMTWVGRETYLAVGTHSTSTLRLVPFGSPSKPQGALEFGFSPANFALSDGVDEISFPGAHGEEIVRDVYVDSESSTAFTCGEDGQVKVWKVPTAGGSEESQSSSKKTKDAKAKKQRYKPY